MRAVNSLLAAAPPIVRHGRDSQQVAAKPSTRSRRQRLRVLARRGRAAGASDEFPPPRPRRPVLRPLPAHRGHGPPRAAIACRRGSRHHHYIAAEVREQFLKRHT
ncbi:MAG: hypothetical protein U0792_23300 [Gemmataceae bacterium]